MNRNTYIFAIVTGAAFALTGGLTLGLLISQGTLSPEGTVIGVAFGLWICFGYLFGRDIYAEDRKNLRNLLLFEAAAIVLGGLIIWGWQIPYIAARQTAKMTVFCEQLAGMLWAGTLAVMYLGYRQLQRRGK